MQYLSWSPRCQSKLWATPGRNHFLWRVHPPWLGSKHSWKWHCPCQTAWEDGVQWLHPPCMPPTVNIAATTNSFKIKSSYFRAEDESNGYVGELTTPVGWGKNADSAGGITPKLQMVSDLPVIDNPTCNDYYGILNAGIMCIDSSDGKGVCNVSRDAPHTDD